MKTPNERLFTLIAYKPNSSDYCRGCHMASYGSNHELLININRDELINKWAQLESIETKSGEADYQINVLTNINGFSTSLKIDSQIIDSIHDRMTEDEWYEFDEPPELKLAYDEIDIIASEIHKKISEIKAARDQRKKNAAEKDRLEKENYKRQSDLEMLGRLKAQYEK